MLDSEMILPSRVEAIIARVHEVLYPVVDSLNITLVRREMLEDLDRILEAAEHYLEGVDNDRLDECVALALGTLSKVRSNSSVSKVQDVVMEEMSRVERFRKKNRVLKEEPELQAGNIQKLANDSLDVALDSYFDKVDDTLDASGEANKEPAEDGSGEMQFSASDFASDVANLVDRAQTLLDLSGTIARRAVNHVGEKYGHDAAENVKQILSANFDIEVDYDRDDEGERVATRPAAIGAGGSGGGGGGGGGAA
jgi:hypothetical protein